jgi:hypothetical protein
MHGPELKSWLDSVALNSNDLGRMLDIKVRTVKYWINFEQPTPPGPVLEMIRTLVSRFEARAGELERELRTTQAPTLLAYRTLEDLAALDPQSFEAGFTPASYRALLWRNRAGRAIRFL